MRQGGRRSGCRGMLLALALLAVPIFAGVAWADSIGPGCEGCFGGIFSLEYVPPDDGSVTIIYTADLTGASGITDIDAIAFKVVSNSLTGGSLDSFTVDGAASGVWGNNFQINGLNSNGCTDSDSGFVCSLAAGGLNGGPDVGHVYVWTFTVNYTGSLFTALNAATIKADFSGAEGEPCFNGCLLSQPITLQQQVPEPGTLMLLGTGLVGLGLARRMVTRRARK